jgi:hypothetical protein
MAYSFGETQKKTNINKIQTFQNIALRKILNAPPYVSNYTIHTDSAVPAQLTPGAKNHF